VKSIGVIPRAAIAVVVAFQVATGAAHAQDCVPRWDDTPSSPGMNSPVNALVALHDPNADEVVAGGRFTQAGGVSASKIAGWNGVDWTPLGDGFEGVGPVVHALVPSVPQLGGSLFAGGQFAAVDGVEARNVARWDGSSWSALGSGVNGPIFAMAIHNDGSGLALFVGGSFTEAGGVPANNVAGWDGTQWFALGSGTNDRVFAMTEFNDATGLKLFVGGDFTAAGGLTAQRVARWNGSGWSTVGAGFNSSVFALRTYDDGQGPGGTRLYAGGNFTQNGGSGVNRVARWDGTVWTGVGTGTNATVRAMTTFDDGTGSGPALYVGGSFTGAGGLSASRIARWDGVAWSALGMGVDNTVFSLVGAQGATDVAPALYVGGSFSTAGTLTANFVARWAGCVVLPADMNGDGRLSVADVPLFTSCLTGPGGGLNIPCAAADTDNDADADLADFSRFALAFMGS